MITWTVGKSLVLTEIVWRNNASDGGVPVGTGPISPRIWPRRAKTIRGSHPNDPTPTPWPRPVETG